MAMNLLEHEGDNIAGGALAARGTATLFTLGTTSNLISRSFLCKKMEIEFTLLPPSETDVSTWNSFKGELVLQNVSVNTGYDTPAEAFDARIDDEEAHRSIIWTRNFQWTETLVDTTTEILTEYHPVSFKTSKSFSKGFPFDKDEQYRWTVFNPDASNAWATGTDIYFKVRYWGVWL